MCLINIIYWWALAGEPVWQCFMGVLSDIRKGCRDWFSGFAIFSHFLCSPLHSVVPDNNPCVLHRGHEQWVLAPEKVLSQQGYGWCSHCWFQLWMFNLTQLLQHTALRAWWGKWDLVSLASQNQISCRTVSHETNVLMNTQNIGYT